MKKFASLVVILLFILSSLCRGFEPYDYQKVPFPDNKDLEFRLMSLVELLTDIAAIADLPETNRAGILAAARRISPLNKRAFSLEYQLSIGQKLPPTSISKPMVNSFMNPHLTTLAAIPGTEEYVVFLKNALDFDQSMKSPVAEPSSSVVPDPFVDEPAKVTASENSCGLLGMDGCIMVKSESRYIDGMKFQFVPDSLKSDIFMSAYRESLKFLALTSSAGLEGKRIDFRVNKKLEEDEGPAGALACAVLTKAVADNFEVDSRVAFAGDVNADGTVQPLDDQRERLLADPESLYRIIVIPKADRFAADDLLLLDGPETFWKTQVLEVSTLAEAVEIASTSRSSKLSQALNQFAEIQEVLNKQGGAKFINNSHVRKRLQSVMQLAPNHISARQLNMASRYQLPNYISLQGSLELIFDALDPVIEKGKIDAYGRLDSRAFEILKRHRKRLDPSLQKLTAATFSFETNGRLGGNNRNERERVQQNLKEEINAISRNVNIREKMMK